jgi:hypothetical protein
VRVAFSAQSHYFQRRLRIGRCIRRLQARRRRRDPRGCYVGTHGARAAGACFQICCLDIFSNLTTLCVMSQNIDRIQGLAGCPALENVWIIETQLDRIQVSFLGDAKSSLGDAKSSLGDAKSSLGDAKSSLGDAKSSLGDVESSLGDAESSPGDAESSLGDAESSLGDA